MSIKTTVYSHQTSFVKTFEVQWPHLCNQLIGVVELSKLRRTLSEPINSFLWCSGRLRQFLEWVQVLLGPLRSLISVEIVFERLIYHTGSLFTSTRASPAWSRRSPWVYYRPASLYQFAACDWSSKSRDLLVNQSDVVKAVVTLRPPFDWTLLFEDDAASWLVNFRSLSSLSSNIEDCWTPLRLE